MNTARDSVAIDSSPSPSSVIVTDEDRKCWDERGYMGPFTAWTPDEMAAMRPRILASYERVSSTYGFRAARDRHLECRTVYEAGTHPAIIERCAAVMGPDLLMWRTNWFPKWAGGPETMFHQGWDFAGPRNVPALDPPKNVTAWLAITDSDRENGCLQLIAGSHLDGRAKYDHVPKGSGIFGSDLKLDCDMSKAVHMEVKAGQFFLFNERTLHGADPNTSDRPRIGIGFRVTPTSTRIYPNQGVCGQGLQLKKWHAILVRGEDTFGYNKIGQPPELDEYPLGPLQKIAGNLRGKWQRRVYGYGRQARTHDEYLKSL